MIGHHDISSIHISSGEQFEMGGGGGRNGVLLWNTYKIL